MRSFLTEIESISLLFELQFRCFKPHQHHHFTMKQVVRLAAILAWTASVQAMPTQTVNYQSSQGTSSPDRIQGLNLVNRFYAPYGPDALKKGSANSTTFTGFGFGMSAVDALAYDYVEKYIYSKSGYMGYITVIDYSSFPPQTTEYNLNLNSYNSGLNDVAICPEQGLFFVSLGDVNTVLVYSTVKRSPPAPAKLVNTLQTGDLTDVIGVNQDCSVLAVANAVDSMKPAVHLVTNFGTTNGAVIRKVSC